jgi:multiubiquitin
MATAETDKREQNKPPKPPKKITIHIDRKPFKVDAPSLTGAQIRALPEPDIGSDYDLWLEVPGGEDERIEIDQVVRLKDGMHFFSAHSHINPGRC